MKIHYEYGNLWVHRGDCMKQEHYNYPDSCENENILFAFRTFGYSFIRYMKYKTIIRPAIRLGNYCFGFMGHYPYSIETNKIGFWNVKNPPDKFNRI